MAIRLVGAVGATVFMNDWPTCLHVTLAELSATTPGEPLVLDAVLRAWTSLAANDAITWSEERSRDLVALVSHAWQHASHFVSVTCHSAQLLTLDVGGQQRRQIVARTHRS